jgi:hypothetical protein
MQEGTFNEAESVSLRVLGGGLGGAFSRLPLQPASNLASSGRYDDPESSSGFFLVRWGLELRIDG